MKKKASLLISGITTVAMLAVAVGSFAAWDTLSASATGLSVSTGTPTSITAEKDESITADTEKLIPADGTSETVLNKTNAKAQVKVGGVKISAKGLPDTGSKVVFTPTIKNSEGTEITDQFKVTLKPQSGDEIEANSNITGLSATAASFDVNVAFAESADANNINTYGDLTNMSVEIKVTASVTP